MARPRKRRRWKLDAPEPIESLIERAGENRFAKQKVAIPVREWRVAVGPRIAERARPMSLERGVLVLRVATAAWANELQMLAPELVARLRVRGFAVDQLRFRVGALDVVERPLERRATRKVPPPVPLAPDLAQEVERIDDEELRNIIGTAARANLAWQAYVGGPGTGPGPAPSAPARMPTRAEDLSAALPASRGPRAAGRESAPPDRSGAGSDAASRRRPGGDSGRRR
jgi:hypothetical protein